MLASLATVLLPIDDDDGTDCCNWLGWVLLAPQTNTIGRVRHKVVEFVALANDSVNLAAKSDDFGAGHRLDDDSSAAESSSLSRALASPSSIHLDQVSPPEVSSDSLVCLSAPASALSRLGEDSPLVRRVILSCCCCCDCVVVAAAVPSLRWINFERPNRSNWRPLQCVHRSSRHQSSLARGQWAAFGRSAKSVGG